MRYTHYLYIVPFALLAACSSEEQISGTDSSGKEAIVLSAGIVEGSLNTVTRTGAEDNHSRHHTLTPNTALALQVSGTWTGHDPVDVIKATTATVGAETATDSKHNNVPCSPVLYWDDYGTADPSNASTGRTEGLTIYGAAINGKTTLPDAIAAPTTAAWAIAWSLKATNEAASSDQTTDGNTPADKDLLISNNVQGNNGDPYETDYGRYLFEKRGSGKLLEFTHALSKITVNLKAGAGFNNSFSSTEVILTSNEANQTTQTEWAYTTGTIDVTTGGVTSQSGAAVVTMNQLATASTGYTVTKEALVMPGSAFPADNKNMLRINADGNIYYVTAAKIRAALIAENSSNTSYITEAGKNYIINVTVNKTAIDDITATVTDWVTVNSEAVSPVINVTANYGTKGSGTDFTNQFSFYRSSTGLNSGYSTEDNILYVNSYYAPVRTVKKDGSTWKMYVGDTETALYWPNHLIHYQFRGVWPETNTTTSDNTKPHVETSGSNQVIKVWNVAYSENSFPSDLQIGRPNVGKDATCSNTETGHHTTKLYDGETVDNVYWGGLCATEGNVNLAFEYMMSQVEVNLTTSGASDNDRVELSGATVEIVNIHNNGEVKLGDRGVILDASPTTYQFTNYTYDGENRKGTCKSAIVPQPLTYDTNNPSNNVKFKITITNTGTPATTDVYYADVQPITLKKADNSTYTATAWESGYHYVYELYLTKTKVNVTATLAEWTTVNANQDVWF